MIHISDFDYHLPPELIACYPLEERRKSRLLMLPKAQPLQHSLFNALPNHLNPNDLLVLNNTQVMRARLLGKKATGGAVEVLIERLLDGNQCLAHVGANRTPALHTCLLFPGNNTLEVIGRQGRLFHLQYHGAESLSALMAQHGQIPLPPYMNREATAFDEDRYQTVFAKRTGAVAAPTAGLHFDDELLNHIRSLGVGICEITLHVGAGTFLPIQSDRIEDHHMHSEWCSIPEAACAQINATRQKGGRVIAVGTTVARSLETAALHCPHPDLQPFEGDTHIFIYPGFKCKIIDVLITNFHLPRSTLLLLVSALGGTVRIQAAYAEAIENNYRFYSYGDAMWVEKYE